MTDKKKQPKKTAGTTSQKAGVVIHPELDYSGHKDGQENETWKKWKVKPDLVAMIGNWPASESGIPKRIAYCRGQLDNLSVEALARYIKNFDSDGISRTTIVRYESGENMPGARELRILCNALWITPNWLLLGSLDSNLQSHVGSKLVDVLAEYVQEVIDNTNTGFTSSIASDLRKASERREIEKRQKWIDEARKPPPK